MKVLVVCSYRNYVINGVAPFISEQVDAIINNGVECDYFLVTGKGVWGYLHNYRKLKEKIYDYKPDIIHAHFGLCGLLANLQRKIPVITTYHGSDINKIGVYLFSIWSMLLSRWNIIVSHRQERRVICKKKYSLIPCGINMELFRPLDRMECRKRMRFDTNIQYVLFSKMFTDPVKNYPLAKASIDRLNMHSQKSGKKTTLLEFTGYSREDAVILLNAVDAVILTSHSEGSPQFIKEAMACCTPIVSVDVGDVKKTIGNTRGCYIVESDADKIANALAKAVSFGTTKGRERIIQLGYSNDLIAQRVIEIYNKVLNNNE